jgi:hypothetical protein
MHVEDQRSVIARDPLREEVNEDLQFANEDDVRHIVTLAGGKLVEDHAAAGQHHGAVSRHRKMSAGAPKSSAHVTQGTSVGPIT